MRYGPKTVWGPSQQAQLDDLTAQKAAFEANATIPLQDVIDRHLLDSDAFAGLPRGMLFAAMRKNADAIRDALAPYDSGIRAATMRNHEGED